MKKTKIFLKMAALAVVGAMMSCCAEEIEVLQPANQRVVQKTTISLADDATTRGAIAADGSTSFSKGDQIAVIYQNTNGKTMKAVSAALTDADLTDEGASATFTVELVSPKAGTKVRYIYPASMAATTIAEDTAPDADLTISTAGLAKQVGTLEAIAKNLGLAVYDGTMSTTATLPTGTGVILKNQLAILKLQSIKDNGDTEIRSQITDLTVIVGTNTYAVTRTAADAPIFVAILPVATAEDITFTAEVDGIVYNKTATGKTLAKNKINPVNLSMAPDFLATPLTIEALEAAVVNFDIYTDAAANPVQYRTFDGTAWTAWANYTDNDPVTLTSIGAKVQFRGDNARYATDTRINTHGSQFSFTADCLAYGNVMSLVDSEHFSTLTTLTSDYAFAFLFCSNSHLKLDDSKPLRLPATQLSKYCYGYMFTSCTGLNTLPQLPATQLAERCYEVMFWKCSGLTAIPEDYLPATQLSIGCYASMFYECSNLTTAPTLPAATLAERCYKSMFCQCPKLNSVTCLATDISASECLAYWLTDAGTADGCERKVYVDPSMLTVATGDSDGQWRLTTSGSGDATRWTLSNKDFLTLTSADIGKVIGANGCIYANAAAAITAGTTARAVIAYVGNATGEAAPYNHGLALALSDANGGGTCQWKTEQTSGGHTYTCNSTFAFSSISESGLQYNDATHKSDTYPAFKYAMANNGAAAPTGCSAWFLPTGYQWQQMITAAGGYSTLRDGFEGVGGTNMQRDGYWTSTELSSYEGGASWRFLFFSGDFSMGSKVEYQYVRACLAF